MAKLAGREADDEDLEEAEVALHAVLAQLRGRVAHLVAHDIFTGLVLADDLQAVAELWRRRRRPLRVVAIVVIAVEQLTLERLVGLEEIVEFTRLLGFHLSYCMSLVAFVSEGSESKSIP